MYILHFYSTHFSKAPTKVFTSLPSRLGHGSRSISLLRYDSTTSVINGAGMNANFGGHT